MLSVITLVITLVIINRGVSDQQIQQPMRARPGRLKPNLMQQAALRHHIEAVGPSMRCAVPTK